MGIEMIFTEEEVKSLNDYQKAGVFHPFTCGGNRCDEKHLDGEGLLVATTEGWICPFCDYKQDWAHPWMKNRAWEESALANKFSFNKWVEDHGR